MRPGKAIFAVLQKLSISLSEDKKSIKIEECERKEYTGFPYYWYHHDKGKGRGNNVDTLNQSDEVDSDSGQGMLHFSLKEDRTKCAPRYLHFKKYFHSSILTTFPGRSAYFLNESLWFQTSARVLRGFQDLKQKYIRASHRAQPPVLMGLFRTSSLSPKFHYLPLCCQVSLSVIDCIIKSLIPDSLKSIFYSIIQV